jgi:amino acid adenylation domain-containing protein
MQEGLLFDSLRDPGSGVDIEQMVMELPEPLDATRLQAAWVAVAQRHTALRTSFRWQGLTRSIQVIEELSRTPFEEHDWRSLSPDQREVRFQHFLAEDRHRGFSMDRCPLFRLALFRFGEMDHRLVWTLHHAILDGRAYPIVLKEVFAFYEALLRGTSLRLPEPPQFRQYIDWLQHQDFSRDEPFWRLLLQGFDHPTPLPDSAGVEDVSPSENSHGQQRVHLSQAVTSALTRLARDNHITLATILEGAWALLLSRYTGETDVVFGVTLTCRRSSVPAAQSIVGLLINTVPTRVQVPPERPLVPWLQSIRRQQLALREHVHTPLVTIQKCSPVPPGTKLFQSLLVVENYDLNSLLQAQGGAWARRRFQLLEQPGFPLTIAVYADKQLLITIEYERKRFDEATITRMLGHLQTLLAGIATEPQRQLRALPWLTAAERHQLLNQWNDTRWMDTDSELVHKLFERQVEQNPGAVALVHGTETLTYQELNRRADELANHLRRLGCKPETIVAVCAERSPDMVVGLLAVLKAGGAFLLLDPSYPDQRLNFMLEDAQVLIVLTQQRFKTRFSASATQVFCLDANWPEPATPTQHTSAFSVVPDALAYVVYTSGSTGQPKAVAIEHRGLSNLVRWHHRTYNVRPSDRATLLAGLSFDASVWELWPYLTAGASVCLVNEETRSSPDRLRDWLLAQQITLSFVPTPLAELMLALDWPAHVTLRAMLTGGDRLRCFAPASLPFKLLNHYGPTETTVVATQGEVPALPARQGAPQIGRPIANTRVYLLDSQLEPVPVGVPGELYIGGAGVARGYLRRADLTAERFLPDQFSNEPGARMYRSGDRARFRPDGSIEFLGRLDEQIKLRGFRIEPGEIESVLALHPGVQQPLVVVHRDGLGQERLVAYFLHREGPSPSPAELKNFLKSKLPDHMLPSSFIPLASFPLTPNGKIDRRALPVFIESGPADLKRPPVLPQTPLEEIVAGLWSELLGCQQAPAHASFFDLGGHSLLAMQLVGRLHAKLGVDLPVRTIFEHPTLKDLANEIQLRLKAQSASAADQPIRPAVRPSDLPLSFAQQRLWFLDQLEPGNVAYNVAIAWRLTGNLQPTILEQSLSHVVQHHESLRTVFADRQGKPIQRILPEQPVSLPVIELEALPEPEREPQALRLASQEAARPFALGRGPLLRTVLFRLGKQDHLFVLVVHHAIFDGWSLRIFAGDVSRSYAALAKGAAPSLPPLPIQYADYTLWQRAWLQGDVLAGQLAYWKQQLTGAPASVDLPTDYTRPQIQPSRGATVPFTISPSRTAALTTLARTEGCTLFMTLLAAFQALLHRYSGQEDFSIGCPHAGRNRPELEGLIGFFVNTLVIRALVNGQLSFRKLLGRVRETALAACAHADLPFEKLVEELQPGRSPGRTPLFQVFFDFDAAEPPCLAIDGVKAKPFRLPTGTAKFDLTLGCDVHGDHLVGELEYNQNLFAEETILQMRDHFLNLLDRLLADPDRPLVTLPLLSQAERLELQQLAHNLSLPSPQPRSVHDLVDAQAARSPGLIALACGDKTLTYQELNRLSTRLAHQIRHLGAGSEKVVGICAEPSLEMVLGLLAILKSGSAYLPLEPQHPHERLAFMLADSEVTLLLSQRRLQSRLPPFSGRVVWLEDALEQASSQSNDCFPTEPSLESLCYVTYTSGSTGQPKGVMIPHRALANHSQAVARLFSLTQNDRVLQFASLSFDVAAEELFPSLIAGATVVLPPEEIRQSLSDFQNLLVSAQITVVNLPTSFWQEWLAALSAGNASLPPSLRLVIVGSESVSTTSLRDWQELVSSKVMWLNAYGPTETTVTATVYQPRNGWQQLDVRTVPIGRPIVNTQAYVLDETLEPVPRGVPGDLYIGGAGLARGYVRRPDLTAELFVPHPFSNEPGARLFRTGDRARYLRDGNLEFLGRQDYQVKLRGFRVELGEIEAALNQQPELRESVVVLREDSPGDKRLIGYVIPKEPGSLDLPRLRNRLASKLPAYMMPSRLVPLEALPLLPNGKVDRRQLPKPEPDVGRHEPPPLGPRSPCEEVLADLWMEVLGTHRFSVHDNFFDLGGHSLLALRLISRLREAFKVALPLRAFFESPTVAGLAAWIKKETQQRQCFAPTSTGTWRFLVPIQPVGSRRPFYLFPGGLGSEAEFLVYAKLARYLGLDQPFYGLKARGANRGEPPHRCVEDMARDYIEDIMRFQPHGPYLLVGECAGGIVAFEVARQFVLQGEEVGLLAFLDTEFPRRNDSVLLQAERLKQKLTGSWPIQFVARAWFHLRQLPKLPRAERWTYLRQKGRMGKQQVAVAFGRAVQATPSAFPNPATFHYFRTLIRYRPKPYPGRLVLLLSEDVYQSGRALGWRVWVAGGLEIHALPGDHHTYIREHVASAAAQLRACLRQAETGVCH